MKTREELIKSSSYWLTMVQGEVFRLLDTYMEEKGLNQKQVAEQLNVSPSYVSQILNGNFNFTISKLIDLSLAVGKVPVIGFESFDDFHHKQKYPEHTYRYTEHKNSDGGCFVDIQVSNLNIGPLDGGKTYNTEIFNYSTYNMIIA